MAKDPEAIGRSSDFILPIVAAGEARRTLSTVSALVTAGVKTIEMTLRHPQSLESLMQVREAFPSLRLGVGTVRTPQDLKKVARIGASFILSPGFSRDVARASMDLGLAYIPGCYTATEIEQALEAGSNCIKYFPTEGLRGYDRLALLLAPYANESLSVVPTGGMTHECIRSFSELSQVAAIGGSWMAPARAVNLGQWAEITDLTRRTLALSRVVRPLREVNSPPETSIRP